MEEKWKDVEGFLGYYQISNLGQIKSVDRITKKNALCKGRILKQHVNPNGYKIIRTSIDGIKNSLTISRLVAKAFVDNPNNFPEVNHLDGDKLNNKCSNLEWTNRAGNMRHAHFSGLKTNKFGKEASAIKYGVEVVNKDGKTVDVLYGQAAMTKKGFQIANVGKCLNGERKHHKGMTFRKIPL